LVGVLLVLALWLVRRVVLRSLVSMPVVTHKLKDRY